MYSLDLNGRQLAHLRGLGQRLEPTLKVGKGGLTPAFFTEFQRLLRARELVKMRFLGSDRKERAALCAQIADEGRCIFIAGVGHTALFYRPNPDESARQVILPEAS